jgi:DNA-binding transcriptional ArsR family regulator
MILCHLASGEKSVMELEELLSARQAAVSQQLSRLRLEGLVTPRRDGKTIYYSLTDDRPRQIMEVVYDLFCRED